MRCSPRWGWGLNGSDDIQNTKRAGLDAASRKSNTPNQLEYDDDDDDDIVEVTGGSVDHGNLLLYHTSLSDHHGGTI